MKKSSVYGLLFVLAFQLAASFGQPASAAFTCSYLGYGRDPNPVLPGYETCNSAFLTCEKYRLGMETLSACESACWSIGRWNWCETYEGCKSRIDQVEPGSGEEKYMNCIESCRAKKYEPNPDCVGNLKTCCKEVWSGSEAPVINYGTGDSSVEGSADEDSVYDTDEITTDVETTDESATGEIFVSPAEFTLSADGSSSQEIIAYVKDANGRATTTPVWIDLRTPNRIRAGTLEITSGNEGAGDTEIDAVYTAPEIASSEKESAGDEIKDLIYVYAEIDGETRYKVINAILTTQAEGLTVDLTIEKEGFKTKTLQAEFDKGALTGNPVVKVNGQAYPVNDAKVSLKGAPADKGQTALALEKKSENGSFWFERIDEEGENDLGEIEMELEDEPADFYGKGARYAKSLQKTAAKSGGDFAGAHFMTAMDEMVEKLSADKAENASKYLGGIKMAAYSLYFTDYYSRKASESMENYRLYMTNILKDTVGFVTGIWNMTGGVFNAAKDTSGTIGKAVVTWAGKEGKNSLNNVLKGAFRMITGILKKGIALDTARNGNYMGYLAEFLGGLENALTTYAVNDIDDMSKSVKENIDSYLKRIYLRDISASLKDFTVSAEKIPDDLDARIKAAEELFKANTEKHDRRNAIQYEWDVDTAALTEFINVAKPFAKIYAMTHYPDPATVNKAIDAAGNAFNALKVAASANHVYEWNALYYEDMVSLYGSLSLMYEGRASILYDDGYIRTVTADADLPFFYDDAAGVLVVGKPVAIAQAVAVPLTPILENIADAVEAGNDAELSRYLEGLDTARNAQIAEARDISGKIGENMASLSDEEVARALETESLIASMEMDDLLMDMRLLTLAADGGEENVASFRKAAGEYGDNRVKTMALADETNNTLTQKNIINPNTMATTLYMIAGVILLLGLVISIILFVKKKLVMGLVALGVTLVLGLLAGGYGYDQAQKNGAGGAGTETSGNEVSVPKFGEFDVDTDDATDVTPASPTDESAMDPGTADADESATAETQEPAIQPAQPTEPTQDPNRVYNEDFGFSLNVGAGVVSRLTQLPVDDPFYEGAVTFCYGLDDQNYQDFACGAGQVTAFVVNILDDEQYAEETASPFYNPEFDMGENAGLHYLFTHPNGDYPEEAYPLVRSFGDIVGSIEFTR